MDKNNDFIRLDDIFKKLEYGEESYRSGAWSRMKGLLDKEMPVSGKTAGGSVTRYFLLSLLGLLIVGGGIYFANNNFWRKTTASNIVSSKLASTILSTKPDTKNTNLNASKSIIKANANNQPKLGQEKYSVVSTRSQKHKSTYSVNLTESSKTIQRSSVKVSVKNRNIAFHKALATSERTGKRLTAQKSIVSVPKIKISGGEIKNTPKEITINSLTSEKVVSSAIQPILSGSVIVSPEKVGHSMMAFKTIPINIIALQESLPVLEKEKTIRQMKPEKENHFYAKPTIDNTAGQLAIAHHLKKVTGYSNSQGTFGHVQQPKPPTLYQAENGGWYKEQRDTFKQISLMKKVKENELKNNNHLVKPAFDTVSIKEIARVKFIPLSYAEIKSFNLLPDLGKAKPIAGYTLHEYASEATGKVSAGKDLNLVPLQRFMVSSRRIQSGGSALSKFFSTFNSSVSGLMDGNKDWYISLLVGGNLGLGSPNAYGMQIGASFLYSIAQRWTLTLGANYQTSYYSNFLFYDNAINYSLTETQTPQGTLFAGTEYKNQTAVNADKLARLEFPILMYYNLGRVSVFAGPDFAYFFSLKNQLVSSVQTSSVSKLAYNNQNPFITEPYLLNPASDFKARFAAGYSFGVSYDFSRKISLDLRMSQMLWDNTGKYKLDALRHIYHQPTIKLDLDFFLGRKEKVIYIMDRNQ